MGDEDVRDRAWPDLIDRLQGRDACDHVLDDVIADYQGLHALYRAERRAAIQLRHDLDGLRQRPSLMADVAGPNLESLSDENRAWLRSVERSLVQLQEELAQAYSVIGERDRALAASHKQQEDDEAQIARLTVQAVTLQEQLVAANDRVQRLRDDNERLEQRESNDALQEKCRKLELENGFMLARLMQLSDQRSDALNEMNEIVQRTRSLLDVNVDDGAAAEASCTILDPEAWANLFRDATIPAQDVAVAERGSGPATPVPKP